MGRGLFLTSCMPPKLAFKIKEACPKRPNFDPYQPVDDGQPIPSSLVNSFSIAGLQAHGRVPEDPTRELGLPGESPENRWELINPHVMVSL